MTGKHTPHREKNNPKIVFCFNLKNYIVGFKPTRYFTRKSDFFASVLWYTSLNPGLVCYEGTVQTTEPLYCLEIYKMDF